jgi:hypothetical protein
VSYAKVEIMAAALRRPTIGPRPMGPTAATFDAMTRDPLHPPAGTGFAPEVGEGT